MNDFFSMIYEWLTHKSGNFKGGEIPNWVFLISALLFIFSSIKFKKKDKNKNNKHK